MLQIEMTPEQEQEFFEEFRRNAARQAATYSTTIKPMPSRRQS